MSINFHPAPPPHSSVDDVVSSIIEAHETRKTQGFVLVRLVKTLRKKLFPQSDAFQNIHRWDNKFSDLLVHLFLNSVPKPCWKRLIHNLVVEEFQHTAPFDGNEGLVIYASNQVQQLQAAVAALGQEKEIFNFCQESILLHSNPVVEMRWRKLFTRGSFIHSTTSVPPGWTILHHAAWSGSPGSITACLRLGVGIETKDNSGNTALHVAAALGKWEAIKCLIQSGADPQSKNEAGFNALQQCLASLNRCKWRERLSPKNFVGCVSLLCMYDPLNIWKPQECDVSSDKRGSYLEEHPFCLIVALCHDDLYLLNSVLKYVSSGLSRSSFNTDAIRFALLASVRRRRANAVMALFEQFHNIVCPVFADTTTMQPSPHIITPGITGFLRMLLSMAIIDSQQGICTYLIAKVSAFMAQFFASSSLLSIEAEEVKGINMALLSCNTFVLSAILQGKSSLLLRLLQSSLLTSDELLITPLNTFLQLEEVDDTVIHEAQQLSLQHLSAEIFCRSKSSLLLNDDVLRYLAKLSPLSLACLIGCKHSVTLILDSMTEKLSCANYCKTYSLDSYNCFHPIMCCAVTCNHECLDILRKHMGQTEFSAACQFISGGCDAFGWLLALLNYHIWRQEASPAVTKQTFPFLEQIVLTYHDVFPTVDILLEAKVHAKKSLSQRVDNIDVDDVVETACSSHWASKLCVVSVELCNTHLRLEALFPDGILKINGAQDFVAIEELSRAPQSKSTRDSNTEFMDASSTTGTPPRKKSNQVSQMVSHFTKMQEGSSPQKQGTPNKKGSSKTCPGAEDIFLALETLVGDQDLKLQKKYKQICIKPDVVSMLLGVRHCVSRSEASWQSIEQRILENPITLFNNLKLLSRSPPLDQNCFNKLGHALLLLLRSKNLDVTVDAKAKSSVIQGISQTAGLPAPTTAKPTDQWMQFVGFLNARFQVSQKDTSTARMIQSSKAFADVFLAFSHPFGTNFQFLLQSVQLGLSSSTTVIHPQVYVEVTKLFGEVRGFMEKPGYFDHLRTTKLKSGSYVHPRVLDTLKLLFNWVNAVLDDAALLYDQHHLLDAISTYAKGNNFINPIHIETINGLPAPYCSFSQMQAFVYSLEAINLLDRRSYLQALLNELSRLGNPLSYTKQSLLSALLTSPTSLDSQQCTVFGALNNTFQGLHRVMTECVLAGVMSESERITTFLGICPFTSVSRVHFRTLQRSKAAMEGDVGSLSSLFETVACMLIKNRSKLGMDVSKMDAYGKSPLLLLCCLKYWRAARLLIETTLTDPMNESISLALYPLLDTKTHSNFVSAFIHGGVAKGGDSESLMLQENCGGVMLIKPLHFAVLHNAVDFIKFFLSACPNVTLDVSLFYLAVASGTAETTGMLLLSKSDSFNADTPACLAFPVPVFTACEQQAQLKIDRRSKTSCSSRFRSRRSVAVAQLKQVLRRVIEGFNLERVSGAAIKVITNSKQQPLTLHEQTLIFECEWEMYQNGVALVSVGRIIPLLQGTLQGLCSVTDEVDHRSKGFKGGKLLMMDGSTVDYATFASDISHFLRALPIPMFSGGALGTSSTILHNVVSFATPYSSAITTDSLAELLGELMELGISRILCSDSNGQTVVFNAVTKRNYAVALQLLKRAVQVLDPNELNLSPLNSLDSKFFKDLVVKQSALAVHPYVFRVFTDHAKKAIADADTSLNALRQEMFSSAPFDVNIGLLVEMQNRTERVWKYICGCDFKSLLSVSYNSPVGNVLTSIKCAKQALAMLGLPFSQIGAAGPGHLTQASDDSVNVKLKLFESIGTVSIKKALPVTTSQELRALLLTWFRHQFDQQTSLPHSHSDIEASLLMFHRHDISVKDIAENGLPLIRRKIIPVSKMSEVASRGFGGNSRGYLYVNNCNEHLKDIGSSMGRKFVKQRILNNTKLSASQSSNEVGPPRIDALLRSLPSQLQNEAKLTFNDFDRSMSTKATPSDASGGSVASVLSKEILGFFECWKENPEKVLDSLRLAYYVLDFVRLLVSTRYVTSMTHEESLDGYDMDEINGDTSDWSLQAAAPTVSSSASRSMKIPSQLEFQVNRCQHPLDLATTARANAVSQYARVCSLLGNDVGKENETQSTRVSTEFGKGINARIQILDELSTFGVESMFKTKKELCGPNLITLRCFVIEGLTSLLLALNKSQLCEFVSRISRQYHTYHASKPPLPVAAPLQQSNTSTSSSLLEEAANLAADLKKYSQADDHRAFVDLVVCLQHLKISTILGLVYVGIDGKESPRAAESAKQIQAAASHCAELRKTCHAITTFLADVIVLDNSRRFGNGSVGSSTYCSQFCSLLINQRCEELEQYSQGSSTFLMDNLPHDARQNSSNITPPRTPRFYLESAKEAVRKTYESVLMLASMLQSIVGLWDSAALYANDLQYRLPHIQDCNALAAICVPKIIVESNFLTTFFRPTRKILWKCFDLHRDDDLSLGTIHSRLECCKYLMNFGVSILPISSRDNRSPICLAAVMGYYDVLLSLIQSIPSEDLVFESSCLKYLIWHVLMACSHWDERVLGLAKNSYQVHRGGKLRDARPHCLCLEILLEHGFPVETPDNAIYSCADLASLKRVASVFYVAIKRRFASNSRSSSEVVGSTHFQAMHFSFFWQDIDASHFRDIAITSSAKSAKKLFGSLPGSVLSPHINEDISTHVAYVLHQLTIARIGSGGNNEDVTSYSTTHSTKELSRYWKERVEYHVAGSLLSLFPLKHRVEECSVWKFMKYSIIKMCPALAQAARIITAASGTSGSSGSLVPKKTEIAAGFIHFPRQWTNFHLCIAARNPAWLRYLVSAIVGLKQPPRTPTSSRKSPEEILEENKLIETFRESMSSMILTSCYYDSSSSLVCLMQAVAAELRERQGFAAELEPVVDFVDSARLSNAVASAAMVLHSLFPGKYDESTISNQLVASVQVLASPRRNTDTINTFDDSTLEDNLKISPQVLPPEIQSLLVEADTYDPLGRRFTPLDLCLHHHSSNVLLLLLELGVSVNWEHCVHVITCSKFEELACVKVLDALAQTDEFKMKINHSAVLAKSRGSNVTIAGGGSKPKQKVAADSGHGEMLLHYCCRKGFRHLVDRLLAAGADADVVDQDGHCALHYSIVSGHKLITQAIGSFYRRADEAALDDRDIEMVTFREVGDAVVAASTSKSDVISLSPRRSPRSWRSDPSIIRRMLAAVRVLEFSTRQFLLSRYRRKEQLAKFKQDLIRRRQQQQRLLEQQLAEGAQQTANADDSALIFTPRSDYNNDEDGDYYGSGGGGDGDDNHG